MEGEQIVNPEIIAAVLAIIFGPVLAYLAAARKLSGKIATSEAADLWKESAQLRADWREEVERLRARLAALEQVNANLILQNSNALLQTGQLQVQLADCIRENKRLQAVIDELRERMPNGN